MAGKPKSGRRPAVSNRPRYRAAAAVLTAAAVFWGAAVFSPGGFPGLSWVGGLLRAAFGVLRFWLVPAFLAAAWLAWKKTPLSATLFLKTAGWALFLFAVLALAARLTGSGGGRFGAFLAQGAFQAGWWAWLLLPLSGLAGLFLALPPLGRVVLSLLAWLWAATDAEKPAIEASAVPPPPPAEDGPPTEDLPSVSRPVIVERKPAPAPAAPVAPRAPEGAYKLPDLDLLDSRPPAEGGHASGLTRAELEANAHLLEDKLRDFGVEGRVTEVSGGPVITMYEYEPAPGIKIARVAGLADDLARAMKAQSIRVAGHLPGKGTIGIEIPNPKRLPVSFRQMVESPAFQDSGSALPLSLGVDIMGAPVVADLTRMPHLLIAGATGTGKSVSLAAIIMSILYKAPPGKARLLMIDPKMVEFTFYEHIPHLIHPVLTEASKATLALKWAVAEMEDRYRRLAEKGARNIGGYNEMIRAEAGQRRGKDDGPAEMPFLIIVIDELADLMMVAPKDVETHVTRLAQKARAAGIHLILATQRPTTDIITGTIKANLPTRLSLKVLSQIDSRTILDQKGAEKLLGNGDMLFLPPGQSDLRRLHGPYVSDGEIKRVTDFIRAWGPPDYLDDLTLPDAEAEEDGPGEKDEKYAEAVELVRRTRRATISHVQRHLRIGYNRAARIIEDMEHEGLIGPQNGVGPREIF